MARKGQSSDILAGWQAGIGGEDFLRQLVERTVQQVLEAEMTSFLGAETYQRNDSRRGWRKLHRHAHQRSRIDRSTYHAGKPDRHWHEHHRTLVSHRHQHAGIYASHKSAGGVRNYHRILS